MVDVHNCKLFILIYLMSDSLTWPESDNPCQSLNLKLDLVSLDYAGGRWTSGHRTPQLQITNRPIKSGPIHLVNVLKLDASRALT